MLGELRNIGIESWYWSTFEACWQNLATSSIDFLKDYWGRRQISIDKLIGLKK